MTKVLLSFTLAAGVMFGQYKMEPAGAAPPEAAAFQSELQPAGAKVLSSNGTVFCEVWFRKSLPSGPKNTEQAVTLPTIPHGAFVGVIRFPAQGVDRRGQVLKPGVYTLRYSNYPVNGDHLGVAPQRDFVVMTPVAEDKDINATPKFDDLMVMSRKASNTPHPAVLSIATGLGDQFPHFEKEGDSDWVLNIKIGEQPISIILVGRAEA